MSSASSKSAPSSKDIDDLPRCDDTEKEDLKSQYHTTDKIRIIGR